MRVLIVDDDALVAMSLKTILEADTNIEVCGVGTSGREAITLFKKHKPDVLLMDIRMAEMTGLEAAEAILLDYNDARILLLTTFQDDEYIVKALKIGAKGYILKQDFEGIVPAIKAVYGGQNVFGRDIAAKLPNLMQNNTSAKMVNIKEMNISDKEFEIIELVAQGLSNKEISEKQFLSEGTVRNYISGILEKLDLRDRTQLAVYYYRELSNSKE